jgi:hypothetical protein
LLAILISVAAVMGNQTAVRLSPGRVDVLRSVDALPPEIVGRFREPLGFQQPPGGPYYVFDRRGHSVHTVDADRTSTRAVVEIGGEEGRVIDPIAFDVAPDGTFAVADAPNGRERVQIFGAAGFRTGGFFLPGRPGAHVAIGPLVLSGVGSLVYTGRSVILSEPESGWLISEYGLLGTPVRNVGTLRQTGQEADRAVHVALNAGLPLPDGAGGFYYVFLAGTPAFRKYDPQGNLLFERVMQGRELDPIVDAMPRRWPRRRIDDRELPLVAPTVRTAAVDRAGRLWVSFAIPYTYVFDTDGEKIRTVQFRAAGLISPSSLFFGESGRLLVTPGCYEFAIP